MLLLRDYTGKFMLLEKQAIFPPPPILDDFEESLMALHTFS